MSWDLNVINVDCDVIEQACFSLNVSKLSASFLFKLKAFGLAIDAS